MQTSRESEKFIVRLPVGLREQLRASAASNRRSMNSEVIYHLERAIALDDETQKADATA
ncbi:Arc family DNA-binding protein [Rhizobium leguminosarum]|uniref:Arc family DNA-binding protein n=1 Tax=Rhizobium TaxID=379 RepID=UPI00140F7783|nr:Arc family DNA-binding protein [Rhizobium leguminosarum]QIO67486.1 Arc family DNA-binding protein [Rhizobium leguminosarum bv. trifolii]